MAGQSKKFEATSLRGLLIFLMILVLGASAAGFYLGLQYIREYAVEVSHVTQDAVASDSQVVELQKLRQQLAQTKKLVAKANQIFATPSNYQTKAVTDLERYADTSGVEIAGINFRGSVSATDQNAELAIALEQPVSYRQLIHFLQLIENSIPKMQVIEMSVSRPETPNGDNVRVGTIRIKMSVR
jgi:Tfp pilus assembly protein PilO